MNNAFWYIYLADVSISLASITLILSCLSFFFVFTAILIDEISLKKVCMYLIPAIVSTLIFISLPEKITLYMMAASEIKEDPGMSETNKKVIDLINMKLDEALKEKNK